MTPGKQIAARETNRLHMKKLRLGMSSKKNQSEGESKPRDEEIEAKHVTR